MQFQKYRLWENAILATIRDMLLEAWEQAGIRKAVVEKTPEDFGIPGKLWTLGRTRQYIQKQYQKTAFSPNDEISRAEFVTMAVRFFEVCGGGNAEIKEQYTKFSDVSSGYWAAEYIMDAAMRGWIHGYGDGTFRAEQNITRAEVVTIVNRLLDRTADEAYIARNLRKLNTFSDMAKNHWAYLDVMESANAHTALYDNGESWQK